jgi:hypothetical protein
MLTCLKVLLTLAAESVITQSSGTAGALMHVSVLFLLTRAYRCSLARVTGQLSAVLPFVACNGLQALPHPTRVGDGVVRLDLSPVLTLCLFDGSSEEIAGFLISFRVRVRLLESRSSSL